MTTARLAPVSMATVGELMQEIEDANATTSSIARVCEADVGLSSRILGLANSAQFGLSRQVTELAQAVSLVGSNMVRTLAIAGATALLDSRSGFPEARDHAVATASCARVIAGRLGNSRSDAFAAGLLHDVGELLLWQANPQEYASMWAKCDSPEQQMAIETDLYELDHAQVGAEHLFEWRVPELLVDAVGDHHEPRADSSILTIIVAAADEAVTDAIHTPGLDLLGIEGDELESILDDAADEHEQYLSLLCS